MTTPIEKVMDILNAIATHGCGVSDGMEKEELEQCGLWAKEALRELEGMVLVPVEPTEEMLEEASP